MKKFALLCLLAIPAAACNDDNLGGKSDMSIPLDLTINPDLSMRVPNGVICGNTTCNSPQVCCVRPDGAGGATSTCVAAGSCGDGGASEACDGPEDCGSATPDCCATAHFTLPMADMGLMAESADAVCTADAQCPASADTMTVHTKLCHTAADCTNYDGTVPVLGTAAFDSCCTIPQAPGLHFCAPAQASLLIKGIQCN